MIIFASRIFYVDRNIKKITIMTLNNSISIKAQMGAFPATI